jgi:hypothetical protein
VAGRKRYIKRLHAFRIKAPGERWQKLRGV